MLLSQLHAQGLLVRPYYLLEVLSLPTPKSCFNCCSNEMECGKNAGNGLGFRQRERALARFHRCRIALPAVGKLRRLFVAPENASVRIMKNGLD